MGQFSFGPTPAADGYALVLEGINHLELRHLPGEPRLADHEALIQGMYTAMCGTDLEVIDGSSDRVRPPAILGHGWAGRVAAAGPGVDSSLIGSFVVGENVVGACEIGFELPGGFASHFVVPARNLRPLPPFLHGAAACLIEPLAVSVRAVRAAQLRPTDSVLVLGDGVIGLFVARVASLITERVTLQGRHADRLEVARKLGIGNVRQQHDGELDVTRLDEPTVVFEATGRSAGLNAAIEGASHHGRVVLLGDYGGVPVATDATSIVRKELHLTGSNASEGAWDEAVSLASARKVDLEAISKVIVPIDRWPEALQAARERRALRVVMRHRSAR